MVFASATVFPKSRSAASSNSSASEGVHPPNLGGLDVRQEVRELLVRVELEGRRGPQVRGDEAVGVTESLEGGLNEVALGTGVAGRAGEDILDTDESHDLLQSDGTDDTGTTRGRDKTDHDGSALSGDLHRNGMRQTDLVSPVTTADRDKSELGADHGTTDSGGDLLSDLKKFLKDD